MPGSFDMSDTSVSKDFLEVSQECFGSVWCDLKKRSICCPRNLNEIDHHYGLADNWHRAGVAL